VNGQKVDIPSYLVKAGDTIAVRERSRNLRLIKESVEGAKSRGVPEWLELDPEALSGRVKSLPSRDQIDVQVQEHLIVEHYSR